MPRLVLVWVTRRVATTAWWTARPIRPGAAAATAGPIATALSAKSSNAASPKRRVGVTLPTFSAETSRRQASVAASPNAARAPEPALRRRPRGTASPPERLIARAPGGGQHVIGDGAGDVHGRRALDPVPSRDPVHLDHEGAAVLRPQEIDARVVGLQ